MKTYGRLRCIEIMREVYRFLSIVAFCVWFTGNFATYLQSVPYNPRLIYKTVWYVNASKNQQYPFYVFDLIKRSGGSELLLYLIFVSYRKGEYYLDLWILLCAATVKIIFWYVNNIKGINLEKKVGRFTKI